MPSYFFFIHIDIVSTDGGRRRTAAANDFRFLLVFFLHFHFFDSLSPRYWQLFQQLLRSESFFEGLTSPSAVASRGIIFHKKYDMMMMILGFWCFFLSLIQIMKMQKNTANKSESGLQSTISYEHFFFQLLNFQSRLSLSRNSNFV